MAYQFDLNVQLEDDDDGNLPFDLNDPVMEDHGNVCFHFFCIIPCTFYHSLSFFYTGIDLNLPLDEFGAVDFDYVQNLPGNSFSTCYNAPSHLKVDDPQFCAVAKQDGFDIRLICQPPNSPDFNILDLGFFRAIQAIQYKKDAKTLKYLIPAVQHVHPFQSFNTTKFVSKI